MQWHWCETADARGLVPGSRCKSADARVSPHGRWRQCADMRVLMEWRCINSADTAVPMFGSWDNNPVESQSSEGGTTTCWSDRALESWRINLMKSQIFCWCLPERQAAGETNFRFDGAMDQFSYGAIERRKREETYCSDGEIHVNFGLCNNKPKYRCVLRHSPRVTWRTSNNSTQLLVMSQWICW